MIRPKGLARPQRAAGEACSGIGMTEREAATVING